MGKTFHVWRGLVLLLLTATTTAHAEEKLNGWERFKRNHNMTNSIQLGGEYDTNVFKRFGGSDKDGVARLLLKSRGQVRLGRRWRVGWNYQGGGKLYFTKHAQDLLIQYIETPISYTISPRVRLLINPEFKFQDENNKVDETTNPSKDVNEDYYSFTGRVGFQILLPARITLTPFATYTYFHFVPEVNYTFHRERGGLNLSKRLPFDLSVGTGYDYHSQQFAGPPREDSGHQVSVFAQYANTIVGSLRYTYQNISSTIPQYGFRNHRITALFSIPIDIGGSTDGDQDETSAEPLFTFHFYGTLQIKDFNSVFDYTPEGERFLLTGAEDDNFNSLVFKLSIHPLPKTTFELKYTRHSNEYSSQQADYERTLYYGGVRYSF